MIIRLLLQDSIEQQVAVVLDGDLNDVAVHKEKWYSKHYCNPEGKSLIFGAYLDGTLVGVNAFMPMLYTYNHKVYNVLQSCDTFVLSKCRGCGIWSKIMQYAMNYIKNLGIYDFIIGFPNFSTSYQGFLKLGWKHVLDVDNYILVNNSRNIFKTSPKLKKIQKFSKIIEIPKILLWLTSVTTHTCVITSDNAYISHDIEKQGLTLCTHKTWYSWKQHYCNLQSLVLNDNHGNVIKCIYGISQYRQDNILRIYQLEVNNINTKTRKLVAEVIKHISRYNPETLFFRYWLTNNNKLKNILLSLGFLRSTHRNPFIVYTLKDDNMFIYNRKLWNISFMDLD